MGSSSHNTHGISKRVLYSESVIKMLQHGIEKLNFSDGQVIYSELGKHILQHGSEIFYF